MYKRQKANELIAYDELTKDEYSIKVRNTPLLSGNSKTEYSFNMPLMTCQYTTSICRRHCYACKGHFVYKNVINAGMRRFIKITRESLDDLVKEMIMEIPWGIKHFRWNGTGDFTAKTLMLLNAVADIRKDIKFYAYTRDPYLASFLNRKVTLNFSVDKESMWKLKELKHPAVLVNYLKTDIDEQVPKEVGLVHPLNNKIRIAENDIKSCPYAVTKGKIKCDQCKICIKPKKSKLLNLL